MTTEEFDAATRAALEARDLEELDRLIALAEQYDAEGRDESGEVVR